MAMASANADSPLRRLRPRFSGIYALTDRRFSFICPATVFESSLSLINCSRYKRD